MKKAEESMLNDELLDAVTGGGVGLLDPESSSLIIVG